jgi:hypothetical protein
MQIQCETKLLPILFKESRKQHKKSLFSVRFSISDHQTQIQGTPDKDLPQNVCHDSGFFMNSFTGDFDLPK